MSRLSTLLAANDVCYFSYDSLKRHTYSNSPLSSLDYECPEGLCGYCLFDGRSRRIQEKLGEE